MFTGIIETMAAVISRSQTGLTLERPRDFTDIKEGASISVAGACLSVTKFTETQMQFDVVPETWSKTTLGGLTSGDRVNLERAMKASDRFEGHVVQGHIEGVAEVLSLSANVLMLRLPQDLIRTTVPKGSIAIDGVSLTVASVTGDTIAVALIPHTLAHTTLGSLAAKKSVNIETDLFVRAVLSRTVQP